MKIAKVRVVTRDRIRQCSYPDGLSGSAAIGAYFNGDRDVLHAYAHVIQPGQELYIGPRSIDLLAYIWKGEVEVGGHRLDAGSSLTVEHGGSLLVTGSNTPALLVSFTAAQLSAKPRAGGHIHLLPANRVPRVVEMGSGAGIKGGMHFDSGCPTCELWLHENQFRSSGPMSAEEEKRGAHSHEQDEIIFVTEGQIKLGNRLFGPGSAIAVDANTMYYFRSGPEGLSFINFRAQTPTEIRFANGMVVSETGNWRKRLGGARPEYLELVP